MNKRLSAVNAVDLPAHVIRPKYDVKAHKAGIVHIGIGAFHRGHQAVFTDDAIAHSGGDWRIIGVSLRSPVVGQQLNPQDGLYTVQASNKNKTECRLIGSVKNVVDANSNKQAVINVIADTAIKVLTITVTEKGYHYDMSNDQLLDNDQIYHDKRFPNEPCTMPGFIVAACAARMRKSNSKLSIISCDNLPNNGEITRQVVLQLAAFTSSELVEWINCNVSFSSSMVDRIVPAITDRALQERENALGMQDHAMVDTELFKQWVIEDNFCTEIPNWQAAGALIVPNVKAYEQLKLRTLNGAHSALAYMGVLMGYKWIHEAIADPQLLLMTKQLMQNETGPSITVPDGFDLKVYQQQTIARFQNEHIPYATQQVAMDGSQKLNQRIFQVLIENVSYLQNRQTKILVTVWACWLRYLQAYDEHGKSYDIHDPLYEQLYKIVKEASQDPVSLVSLLLKRTNIIPVELANNTLIISDLINALTDLQSMGLRGFLRTKVLI